MPRVRNRRIEVYCTDSEYDDICEKHKPLQSERQDSDYYHRAINHSEKISCC